jgi:acetyl/propionyl-CoA carboxylase alpha subunit
LEFPDLPGIRVDTGFSSGAVISTFYDPMLAKVIGYAHTRDEACARLARALTESRIHGVSTNRDLLVGILREPEFQAGAIDTGYLERHDPAGLMAAAGNPGTLPVHAAVAALAAQAERRAVTPVLPGLPSGFRTLPSAPQQVSYTSGDAQVDVCYRFDRKTVRVSVDDRSLDVALLSASGDLVDAEIDGVRRHYRVLRDGRDVYVDSALGATALREVERFPDPSSLAEAGSLVAPMPGAVVRVEVAAGASVAAGSTVIVLEAMKMEHAVRTPADGIVTAISVAVGDQVDSGQVLAVVSADES